MAAAAPLLSLAESTLVPYEFSGSANKTTCKPPQVQQCIAAIPPLVFAPFIDVIPKHVNDFCAEVLLFLQFGLPPGCVLVNPWGDGNCLIYSLAIIMGITLGKDVLPDDWFVDQNHDIISTSKTVVHVRTLMKSLSEDLTHGTNINPRFVQALPSMD